MLMFAISSFAMLMTDLSENNGCTSTTHRTCTSSCEGPYKYLILVLVVYEYCSRDNIIVATSGFVTVCGIIYECRFKFVRFRAIPDLICTSLAVFDSVTFLTERDRVPPFSSRLALCAFRHGCIHAAEDGCR